EQRGRALRVSLFYFLVAQRAIVGAILQPQRHRTLRRRTVPALETADQLRAARVGDLFFSYRVEHLSERHSAIEQQRNVPHHRRVTRQQSILPDLRRSIQQRVEIQLRNVNRIAEL